MAITTIDGRSQQEKQIFTSAADKLKPNELHGRSRKAYFRILEGTDVTLDTNSVMNIGVTRLPAGARVLAGKVDTEDFGAAWSVDVGVAAVDGSGEIDSAAVSDDVDFFTGAVIDINSAGQFAFAVDKASNFATEIEKETILTFQFASTGTVTKIAAAEMKGYVEYVVD